jgi:hypothetical protein
MAFGNWSTAGMIPRELPLRMKIIISNFGEPKENYEISRKLFGSIR